MSVITIKSPTVKRKVLGLPAKVLKQPVNGQFVEVNERTPVVVEIMANGFGIITDGMAENETVPLDDPKRFYSAYDIAKALSLEKG